MTTEGKEVAVRPMDRLKAMLKAPSVVEQFQNAVGENSAIFAASIVDLFGNDKQLQECNPNAVVMECLKAATLRLPINKQLGMAYVIAYKGVPQFQLGYKGLIQLAMRSGEYRTINAGNVCEGELVANDKLTGKIDLSGDPSSEEVVGYFAHVATVRGYEKTMYWSRSKMEAHAKKYSASFNRSSSPWKTNFDSMAQKTMLRMLLGKYGQLSVEMAHAMGHDEEPMEATADPMSEANGDIIDIEATEVPGNIDPETGELNGPPSPEVLAANESIPPCDF